jgi:putative hydrolase of the HAD superfamily
MIRGLVWDLFGVLYRSADDGRGLVRNQALLDFSQDQHSSLKIGMLSNSNPGVAERFFTAEEATSFFDTLVVSGEVGLAKPQPEIFYLVCQRLGLPPQDVIFVDDQPVFCQAAAEAGMQSVIYISNQQVIKEVNAIINA